MNLEEGPACQGPFKHRSLKLSDDLGHSTRTNSAATLTDSKAEAFLHCHRVNQLSGDGHIVARHNHLGALGQVSNTSDVGGAK